MVVKLWQEFCRELLGPQQEGSELTAMFIVPTSFCESVARALRGAKRPIKPHLQRLPGWSRRLWVGGLVTSRCLRSGLRGNHEGQDQVHQKRRTTWGLPRPYLNLLIPGDTCMLDSNQLPRPLRVVQNQVFGGPDMSDLHLQLKCTARTINNCNSDGLFCPLRSLEAVSAILAKSQEVQVCICNFNSFLKNKQSVCNNFGGVGNWHLSAK